MQRKTRKLLGKGARDLREGNTPLPLSAAAPGSHKEGTQPRRHRIFLPGEGFSTSAISPTDERSLLSTQAAGSTTRDLGPRPNLDVTTFSAIEYGFKLRVRTVGVQDDESFSDIDLRCRKHSLL